MNHEKVNAFWAINVKFREAFTGTPIYLKNNTDGKTYRLDEEGRSMGVWADASQIVDTPKERCKINMKNVVMPTEFLDKKLEP